jgi:Domain of unknown function (DUF6134)
MIPLLIVFVIKRMKRDSFLSKSILNIKKLLLKFKVVLCFLIVTCTYGSNDKPAKYITYNVVKNNKVIGTIQIDQYAAGDSIVYNLESNIQAKLILEFNISGKEKSVYKDGILIYSSVYRRVNNKVKTNHNISYSDGQYQLNSFDKVTNLNLTAIEQNLVALYFKEPKDIDALYCDNLKQMIAVKPLGDGAYRVDFSSGTYNIFHYKNGKCVKIDANSKLFNVTLIPA